MRTLVDNDGGYVRPLFDRAMDAVLAETPEAERRWLAGEDPFAAAKGHPTMGNAPAAPAK